MKRHGNWALISFHVNDLGVDRLGEFTISPEDQPKVLPEVRRSAAADELFYLATCNRVEYLFYSEGPLKMEGLMLLRDNPKIITRFDKILEHLLRVCSGRDSVVLGESQILGQFKRAIDSCCEMGLMRARLNPTLQSIVRETKALRTKLKIKNFPTSISTVAGKIIVDSFSLPSTPIVLVGFSETNQILARFLSKWSFNNIYWANRTESRLEKLPRGNDIKVLKWEDFVSGNLPEAAVVCIATRSNRYLLSEKALMTSGAQLVLDLAVPANAEKDIVAASGAKYVGIEEINQLLTEKKKEAQGQLQLVDSELEDMVQRLSEEHDLRSSSHVLADAVDRAKDLYHEELEIILEKLSHLEGPHKETIEEWGRKLVNKITHNHLQTLKSIISKSDPQ